MKISLRVRFSIEEQIHRVRFSNKFFTTRQILNAEFYNVLDFELKIFHLFQS